MQFSRRGLVAGAAASLAFPFVRRARAVVQTVRTADTATGNAGALQARLIDAMPSSLKEGLNIEWVTGNPGQMQVQLISGTLDVAFSGSIGTVDLNARAPIWCCLDRARIFTSGGSSAATARISRRAT